MESLAALVVAIAIAFGFIATFVGFCVGDNLKSLPLSAIGAIVPAAIFGWYTHNWVVGLFWLVCYTLGYMVGQIFQR